MTLATVQFSFSCNHGNITENAICNMKPLLFTLCAVFGQDSWETVGKKKSVGKEGVPAETKERRVDKDGRGRGGPNRRGRGASRTQEGV